MAALAAPSNNHDVRFRINLLPNHLWLHFLAFSSSELTTGMPLSFILVTFRSHSEHLFVYYPFLLITPYLDTIVNDPDLSNPYELVLNHSTVHQSLWTILCVIRIPGHLILIFLCQAKNDM